MCDDTAIIESLRGKLAILASLPAMTPEHDGEIEYYHKEVQATRREALNRAEWPELEAEIVRIGEVRQVIQKLTALRRISSTSEETRNDR